MNPILAQVKENFLLLLGTKERLSPLFRLKYKQQFVSEKTDIVIEGAPSSGNSYAVETFKLAQSRPIIIAHHLHIPLQISIAVKLHIPCIVLVREPVDAVISRLCRRGRFVPGNSLTYRMFRLRLWHWMVFYRALLPYLDRCVLCFFEELKHNFAMTIDKVNKLYNTEFDLPNESIQENALRRLSEAVRPTQWREELKKEMKIWAENERELRTHINEARRVYSLFYYYRNHR